jgi:putative aldouronate transport system permease protein
MSEKTLGTPESVVVEQTATDSARPEVAPDAPPPAATVVKRRKVPLRARLRRDWPLLAMTAPAAVVVLIFHYLPTIGNVIAFQDYNPFAGDNPIESFLASEWIGFGNFEVLFNNPLFWDALRNTLAITAFQLVFYFPLPIFLAILLNSVLSAKMRSFIQSVVYLPHFFSWVLVITFFVQMLGGAGLLAQEMRQAGFEPWNIMGNPDAFIVVVTAEAVGKDLGWGAIVFLAALSAIDQNLYEAAAVDGAGRWRRLWHVTLPGLRPVIVLLLILRLGDALSVGFEQYILQREAVGRQAAEVLDTFVFYNAIVTQQYGFGAAAGLFKAVVGLVLILAANKLAHRLGEQGVYSRV